MKLGPVIRRMFGPYDRRISELYRSLFMDFDVLIAQMRLWKSNSERILEVGCGEGTVTQRLRVAYPEADITAIDISPRLGRLYQGSRERIRFIQCGAHEIAAAEKGRFDFVVLCDVLHHVPLSSRLGLLEEIRATLAPGGSLIFKEWQRNCTPIHWLGYASDRWITGDRISYMTRIEIREYLAYTFGEAALVAEARIRPWWNNLVVLVRP
jgi:2-polyprenyl-3-methyl-5-hydroxy-6-metoxy-1,4-benzoquinol methylase